MALLKKKEKKVSNNKKNIHRFRVCRCVRLSDVSLCLSVSVWSLHATRVVEGLQGPEVSPGWRKTVLQEPTTALTGRLEQLNVTPQPRLREREIFIIHSI